MYDKKEYGCIIRAQVSAVTTDAVGKLKAAFLFHVRRDVAASRALLRELFPAAREPDVDAPLDVTVLAVATHVLDDVPAGDPRYTLHTTQPPLHAIPCRTRARSQIPYTHILLHANPLCYPHRLSINRPTKRGKEKFRSDGHYQREKEMDDHLLACREILERKTHSGTHALPKSEHHF
jgi:hypothetical protein